MDDLVELSRDQNSTLMQAWMIGNVPDRKDIQALSFMVHFVLNDGTRRRASKGES